MPAPSSRANDIKSDNLTMKVSNSPFAIVSTSQSDIIYKNELELLKNITESIVLQAQTPLVELERLLSLKATGVNIETDLQVLALPNLHRRTSVHSSTSTSSSSNVTTSEKLSTTTTSQRKPPTSIPPEKKDHAYYERRKKNNDAAKKSRDSRRIKEEITAERAAFLEEENRMLHLHINKLKAEIAKYQVLIFAKSFDVTK